jgi:hypothetical protein
MLRTLSFSSRGAVRAIKRPIGHISRWPQSVQVTPAACWMAALAVTLPLSCLGA